MNLQHLSKVREGDLGHICHSASRLGALECFSFTLPSAGPESLLSLGILDRDQHKGMSISSNVERRFGACAQQVKHRLFDYERKAVARFVRLFPPSLLRRRKERGGDAREEFAEPMLP
jgi:hypothetical protein